MPVNPWDFRFEGDPDDEPDDLGADLEAAFLELEKLRYLFPSTDEFIYVADEDPVLNEYVVRKGTRRPDKYSCLRYWQFLVLDGPTAKTAYHMRACEFCRTTMREAVDSSASANLKALYDRLWTMPLDPTDEEVEQMEALADLKNALRELEDEAAAERVTARKEAAMRKDESIGTASFVVDSRVDQVREPTKARTLGRRQFFAAVAGFGFLAIGAFGGAYWEARANRVAKADVNSSTSLAMFRQLDAMFASAGVNGVASFYASGSDGEAIRTLNWIENRKALPMYGFLVQTGMTDPRTDIRWHALNIGLRLSPVSLKPHLSTLQLNAAAETNVSIQSLYVRLIAIVQAA